MAIPPNALFVRIKHLGNSKGSIYLNDIDSYLNRFENLKVPVYVPFEKTVDIPLVDEVLLSYKRGSIFQNVKANRIEAYIFSEKCVEEVTNTSQYQIRPDSDIVLVDTSLSNVTVSLPEVGFQPEGRTLLIKKTTSDNNQLIVEASGTNRIDRNSIAIVTTENFGAFTLRTGMMGWWIASEYPLPSPISGTQAPYTEEVFDITNPKNGTTLTLQHPPLSHSEGVFWNGVWLTKGLGKDYVINTNIIELTSDIPLLPGDLVTVNYQYEP